MGDYFETFLFLGVFVLCVWGFNIERNFMDVFHCRVWKIDLPFWHVFTWDPKSRWVLCLFGLKSCLIGHGVL